jgi:hypothetical protein
MLPVALTTPVTYVPVVANTATFDTPPTVTFALPFMVCMSMLVVPFWILSPRMLPPSVALPVTLKLPVIATLPVIDNVFAPEFKFIK